MWKPRNACGKSELALFEAQPVQTDIESYSYTQIYPVGTVENASVIEFSVPGSADDYIDMDEMKLCLHVQVKKSDGTDLGEADKRVFPANNWLHTLFSDASLSLNETQVEGGNYLYPYKAYLMNLLLYGDQAKRCQLQLSGFAKDEAGKMTSAENSGFKIRHSWIAKSRTLDMMAPLQLDLCQQGKLLISQVDMRLKLTRSQTAFNMISLGTTTTAGSGDTATTTTSEPLQVKVEITKASLFVRRVKISPDVARQHESSLQLQNAIYPHNRVAMDTYTIAGGSRSHVKENIFHGEMPKLLVVGLLANEAFNGKLDTNPFLFKHYNVNYVGLFKDGIPFPHEPFKPDFQHSLYSREYDAFITALGLSGEDAAIDITRNDFGNGYTLFVFNLSPDKALAGHGQPLRDGNLRIELKFAQPLVKPINVLVFGTFDSQLDISRLRKVVMQ